MGEEPAESTTCPNCGYVAKRAMKFCPQCGGKIKVIAFCPECGNKVKKGAKFCPNCGKDLIRKTPKAPPTKIATAPQVTSAILSNFKRILTSKYFWFSIIGLIGCVIAINGISYKWLGVDFSYQVDWGRRYFTWYWTGWEFAFGELYLAKTAFHPFLILIGGLIGLVISLWDVIGAILKPIINLRSSRYIDEILGISVSKKLLLLSGILILVGAIWSVIDLSDWRYGYMVEAFGSDYTSLADEGWLCEGIAMTFIGGILVLANYLLTIIQRQHE